ncbi:hypothetical protein G9464_12585 [Halostella sp. JP-L12]|uniref:HalOD1 output domain-containing protein n=1 Tax=Halostella TaxID=1843185 RepID=UPI000EF7FDD9|nr:MULTISPECIES: HalOD1 output domain-containing protein [Halostella]NHN48424.1 hypothetical protein [Halostella sp. JP-L12]
MSVELPTHTERTAENDPVSQTVVLAVADATGDDPLELPPLFDTVDPDALDKLFADRIDGTERLGGRFEFAYAGCEVSVHADGTVDVVPVAEETAGAARAVISD